MTEQQAEPPVVETTEEPQDFTEFEAAANAEPSDGEPEKEAEQPPEVNDEGEPKDKTRSRSPDRRIAHYRWQLGEVERENLSLKQQLGLAERPDAGAKKEPPIKPNPDDERYEFGIHDALYAEDREKYLEELADWKVEQKFGAREKQTSEQAAKAQMFGKIEEGYVNIETKGTEKYPDFQEKIEAAVEERGGVDPATGQPINPLHPMVSIGLAVSPAGADIAYKLATDSKAADRLEGLAQSNPQAAAIAFGELEGEFLDGNDDDLNPADPLDMARMVGRMRARLTRGPVAEAKPVKTTNAPEPPKHQARGGGGQFTVDGTTTDFAAFERVANRSK